MSTLKLFNKKNLIVTMTCALLGSIAIIPASYARDNQSSPTLPYLTLHLARKAASAALQQCRQNGYAVSVAVVDRSGTLLVHMRDPLAGPHTVGSSQGKAFTSASMGQPTAGLAEAIANTPAIEGLRDMDPRLVILAGGLPIVINGQRIGGIGVGGAPGGQLDEACATAGLQEIGSN